MPLIQQIRWGCLQLAAQLAEKDDTITDVLKNANRFVFFVEATPPETPEAKH